MRIRHMQKIRAWFSKHYHNLMQIRDTPHAIAGGLGLGLFIGFLPVLVPFVPAKMLLGILLAWLFRCSKLSAVIGVNCHDVVLPVWPLVLRWQYIIGYWILSHPHKLPPKLPSLQKHLSVVNEHLTMSEWIHRWAQHWLHWKTLRLVWWPTFLGAMVLALPLALLSYFIVLKIVQKYQERLTPHQPQTFS